MKKAAVMNNNQTTISVIGNGFVGGAVANGFSRLNPKVYDIDPKRSTCSLAEALQSKFIFVCLPTPMVSAEGGEANLSIIEAFFQQASQHSVNPSSVFVIKSTVPVGTTKRLQKQFPGLRLVHNPEFLTAARANLDFINADRTVLGGDDQDALQSLQELYAGEFPHVPTLTMSSTDSELVKYSANCFLATKTMFFNEIKFLAEKMGATYENVVAGVVSDKRIGPSHTKVPGPDGDFGFGGTCFPKDINALVSTIESCQEDCLVEDNQKRDPKGTHIVPSPSSKIFKAVWERNKEVRKDWDWASSPSAVKGLP